MYESNPMNNPDIPKYRSAKEFANSYDFITVGQVVERCALKTGYPETTFIRTFIKTLIYQYLQQNRVPWETRTMSDSPMNTVLVPVGPDIGMHDRPDSERQMSCDYRKVYTLSWSSKNNRWENVTYWYPGGSPIDNTSFREFFPDLIEPYLPKQNDEDKPESRTAFSTLVDAVKLDEVWRALLALDPHHDFPVQWLNEVKTLCVHISVAERWAEYLISTSPQLATAGNTRKLHTIACRMVAKKLLGDSPALLRNKSELARATRNEVRRLFTNQHNILFPTTVSEQTIRREINDLSQGQTAASTSEKQALSEFCKDRISTMDELISQAAFKPKH